jgi:hypothetical protein
VLAEKEVVQHLLRVTTVAARLKLAFSGWVAQFV